jgi:hypothetical protein
MEAFYKVTFLNEKALRWPGLPNLGVGQHFSIPL